MSYNNTRRFCGQSQVKMAGVPNAVANIEVHFRRVFGEGERLPRQLLRRTQGSTQEEGYHGTLPVEIVPADLLCWLTVRQAHPRESTGEQSAAALSAL
jgi:hypothetical protein